MTKMRLAKHTISHRQDAQAHGHPRPAVAELCGGRMCLRNLIVDGSPISRSVESKQKLGLERTAEAGGQVGRPEWPWAPLKQSVLEGEMHVAMTYMPRGMNIMQ